MPISRQALERFKWVLYVGIPVWFGYGLARDPANLELIKAWFPTKAADAQGDHGRQLPTLEDEWRRYQLEKVVDAELARIAARKQRQQQQQHPADGKSGGSSSSSSSG